MNELGDFAENSMEDVLKEIDTESYEPEVLKNNLPVVLLFYSDDCPPCEFLQPIVVKTAHKFKGKVAFYKIQRQQNRDLTDTLNINSSPTVLFFKNGIESCSRLTGYIQYKEILEAVSRLIDGKCENPLRKQIQCDVAILGAGPAGLTAAIYLARARFKTVVVDESLAGGQVLTTYHIANYPGTNGVVRGSDLIRNMKEQAMSFGALIDDMKQVRSVDVLNESKHIDTEDTDFYARAVIICTGAEPRRLPAVGERDYRGRGVHYCAACDGALYQDKKIIVVGGGNSALQEALFLTRFASIVTIIHQYDHFQATQIGLDELKNKKIDIIWNSQVRKLEGNQGLTGVLAENLRTKETIKIDANGVFVYIGTQPKSEIVKEQVNTNEYGYLMVDENLQTNLRGVYAAGDVRDKKVRQIATAVGDGALAAMSVEKFLSESKM